MNDEGIMALPPGQAMQAPTAQAPAVDVDPAAIAAFEQARLQADPNEVIDSLMTAGEQADPATVQQLKAVLDQANLPYELVNAMSEMVDILLEQPENYAMNRQEFVQAGVPEDLLPPEFDAIYLSALSLALDQLLMRQESAPMPQAFANGGIVSLHPIAASLARMGRNGDSMLAHITPQEARMLRRRGGSGTINPYTGLPEYFKKLVKAVTKPIVKAAKAVGNAFKSAGKAVGRAVSSLANGVKSFARSTVGRVITAAALGFFLGPAAASMLGIGKGTALAAALNATVGGMGSSLLAGDNLKTALKNGAVSGITAGVASAVSGAPLMGGTPQYASAGEALAGQWNKATDMASSLLGRTPAAAPPSSVAQLSPFEPSPIQAPESMLGQPGMQMASVPGATMTDVSGGFGQMPAPIPGIDAAAGMPGAAGPLFEAVTPGTPMPMSVYQQNLASAGLAPTSGAASTAAAAARPSVLQELGSAAKSFGNMEFAQGAGHLYEAGFGTPMRALGTTVGGLYLMGAFDPKPPEPLGIVPRQTGSDLVRSDPGSYIPNIETAPPSYYTPGSAPQLAPVGIPGYQSPQAPQFVIGSPFPVAGQPDVMTGRMPGFSRGGIAALAPAKFKSGGFASFPRRNGQISGPGTETSDSIPAMLSDGEFVMTARAVRGAGGGSRREGAKRMYAMMRKFEGKA